MRSPRDTDWDQFWKPGQVKKNSDISWSKKRILGIIDPYLAMRDTILDAGCGSGFFSKYFCERQKKTVSLDYSKEALDLTAQMTGGKSRLVKADLLHQSLNDIFREKFQFIFTDGLFEHFSFEEQRRILNNFLSVLEEGGVVATFVPNLLSPWQIIRPFFMPGIEESPFTLKKAKTLHNLNNFRILQSGGINALPMRFSPDALVGGYFGMLLYVIAQKKSTS